MVSTPRTRHSRPEKEPVTLDLEAERTPADAATEEAAPDAEAGTSASASEGGAAGSEASPAPAQRGNSVPGLILAGLIGGAIALAGAFGMNRAGILTLGDVGDSGLESAQEEMAREMAALKAELVRLDEGDGALGSRLDAIESEINTVRDGIDTLRAADRSGIAEGLSARLKALEQRQTEQAAESGTSFSDGDLTALRGEIGEARNAARTALEAASANAGSLETVRGEIAGLSARMEAETARPEIALAIAAVALKSAIDGGTPFTMQLQTYASVAPGSPEIESLRAMAATGVPTRAQIAAEAGAAANSIVAATNRVDPDAGYLTRMMASLRSLVKVRPVGMVEGNSPAAIAARIEVAISENDYARAIEEFEALPEEARQAGEDFIVRVRARMEADQLIDRALASALRSAG